MIFVSKLNFLYQKNKLCKFLSVFPNEIRNNMATTLNMREDENDFHSSELIIEINYY
jgi:hypothetical protein